jgi:hypothetical protein
MSLKRVYPKRRFEIELIDGEFVMTGPYIEGSDGPVKVWKSKNSKALARQAFDDNADEVAHNYDITLIDKTPGLK